MSWKFCQLSEVIAPEKGSLVSGPFGSNIGSRFFVDEGVPVIRGNNLTKGAEKFVDRGFVFLTGEKAAEFTNCIALENDIIFTAAGSIGQVGIIPAQRAYDYYIISNKQIRARIDKTIADPLFVYLWLSSPKMLQHIEAQNNGGAVPLLNLGIIRRLPVPMPPLPTQQRIAGILSAYDDLIENNRRRTLLLEQAARLLYREWFVHLRFPGHETSKIVDGLPEGWSIELLSDLCVEGDGIQTGPFGSQLHQSDYTDTGVPVVMPKDMKDNKVDCDGIARIPESLADKLGRHRMVPGDTVYGRRGDIGRRAFIGKRQSGFFCGTGCLRIRPDVEKINARYLFETLGSPATAGFIANQAKGSTMPNLSAGALKKVPVLCAPDFLQSQFAEIVEPIFETAEIIDEQNTRLTRARDLLLPRLMDGRIPV